jgi:hypothetical protein
MSGRIVSPNCDVKMDAEVKTVLVENYYQQAVHYTLLVGIASIIEIMTLIKQMAYSNTQAVSSFFFELRTLNDFFVPY